MMMRKLGVVMMFVTGTDEAGQDRTTAGSTEHERRDAVDTGDPKRLAMKDDTTTENYCLLVVVQTCVDAWGYGATRDERAMQEDDRPTERCKVQR